MEDKNAHETEVNEMFAKGIFPDVSELRGGKVIKGCWDHQYKTAEEVLWDIRSEMVMSDNQRVEEGSANMHNSSM